MALPSLSMNKLRKTGWKLFPYALTTEFPYQSLENEMSTASSFLSCLSKAQK